MSPLRSHLVVFPFLAALLATSLPGQEQRPRLDLEQALRLAPALQQGPPPTQWTPDGSLARLDRSGDAAANHRLLRLRPGAEPEALCDARTVLAALGTPVADDADAAMPDWRFVTADTLRLNHQHAVYHWQLGAARAERRLALPAEAEDAVFANGDQRVAFRLRHDLHVLDRERGLRRLTWDGSPDLVYGGAAHRAEFGIQQGLLWSGDGRRLLFYREDQRGIAATPLLDSRAEPPQPVPGRYPVAGSRHSRVTVGVFDAADQSLRWLEHDSDADRYWTNLAFTPDGTQILVALVERGQDRLELVRFDATTGRRGPTLFPESDPEWVEPEHPPRCLPDGRFLWLSPRDGFRHVYLYDQDGRQLAQVTRGAFDVQAVLGLDQAGTGLWFHAAGEDPRQRHLFHASLDGQHIQQVTRERGWHDCRLSPRGDAALDTWSSHTQPPTQAVVELATGAATPLPADPDPLAGLELPGQRFFQVRTAEGIVLYGHLLLPPGLQEDRRHPVLLYVYGGPHVQLVQDRWLGGAPPWLAALAGEGYVVCRLDNRGTPNRGSAFEQAIFRRFGDLEVQDQMLAVEHLRTLPFVDPARIGVHGWSFGGYLTLRLLLAQPDAFACGISGAPVTDWALYETGYTERYMDTPQENPDGYRAASCPPLAGRLKAELLLVHPSDDRTVLFAHSLRFLDACIDAGTYPRFFTYPMQQHGLRGADRSHFLRLLKRFLDERLRPGA